MMLLGDVGMTASWEVLKLMGGMALFWTLLGCFAMGLRWKYRLRHDSQMPVVVEDDNPVAQVHSHFKELLNKIRRRKND